jgi:hypothetical protein
MPIAIQGSTVFNKIEARWIVIAFTVLGFMIEGGKYFNFNRDILGRIAYGRHGKGGEGMRTGVSGVCRASTEGSSITDRTAVIGCSTVPFPPLLFTRPSAVICKAVLHENQFGAAVWVRFNDSFAYSISRARLGRALGPSGAIRCSAIRPCDLAGGFSGHYRVAGHVGNLPPLPADHAALRLHLSSRRCTARGAYTYARVPLGFQIADLLHLSRNPYDKIGHLFGFVPALPPVKS